MTNNEENLIPLKTLAEKYQEKPKNILNWAKAGKITASRIGFTWFVDEKSVKTRLDLNKKISDYNTYLSKQVEEKEYLIQKFENEIFILKNLYDLTPAFQLVLLEISKLIPNKREQAIFLDVMTGKKNIANIAKDYHITIKAITKIQKSNINIINAKSGFLKTYRKQLSELYFENRKLEIIIRTQTEQIKSLSSLVPVKNTQAPPKEITPEIAKLLNMSLFDMDFDVRTLNCFNSLDLKTLEDLLRMTKTNGLEELLICRNFGKKSLANLKYTLRKANIIDSNEWSYLYDFL